MADILFVDSANLQGTEEKLLIQQQITKILQENQFFCTEVDSYALQTLIPFTLLKPQSQTNPFYEFYLALTIKFSDTLLIMKATIFSDNGSQIIAGSQFQRTFLIKFAAALNKNNPDLQVVIHPLTGEILIQYCLWIPECTRLRSLVLDGLITFQKRSAIIFRILQALELVSAQQESNMLFSNVLEKIQHLRPLFFVKNQDSKIQLKPSNEYKMHKNTNFIAENSKIESSQTINVNMIQKMKKTYVQDELLSHVHNSVKLKLYNFIYISLDPTPEIANLNKNIENGNILPKGKFQIQKFQSEGKEIFVQYKSQKSEEIGYQYAIVDKLSKKKNYLSFLKTYIVPKNYFHITNHYLLTLKENISIECQTVNKYLKKNQNIMSFDTKLKILSQISSIACISLERMQNFEPSFQLSNFQMDKNFNFKLISIQKSQMNPRMEILQLFYSILFNKKYFSMRKSGLKTNRFVSLEPLNLQRSGPSVIMKILVRLLQIYEQTLIKSPSIENMLLTVNRIQQIYENMLDGSLITNQEA